jgi:transposase
VRAAGGVGDFSCNKVPRHDSYSGLHKKEKKEKKRKERKKKTKRKKKEKEEEKRRRKKKKKNAQCLHLQHKLSTLVNMEKQKRVLPKYNHQKINNNIQ